MRLKNTLFTYIKAVSCEGFTLVEVLVVILLISIIATIAGNILLISLRSSTKADSSYTVTQAGNYVTQQIIDIIRYAQSFQGVSTDGNYYTTDCTTAPSSPYHYLQLTTNSGDSLTYYCDSSLNAGNNPAISSNSASLIDESSINVNSCNITCTQSSISTPPVLGINMSLSTASQAQAGFSEGNPPLTFSASAIMRNNL